MLEVPSPHLPVIRRPQLLVVIAVVRGPDVHLSLVVPSKCPAQVVGGFCSPETISKRTSIREGTYANARVFTFASRS